MVDARHVKQLREKTGAPMMEAKSALVEAGGDPGKAEEILRKKGKLVAQKKSLRTTSQGLVDSYIHDGGRIGVLLEVNCETDFVARNEEFKKLVHELALHIAASGPLYVSRDQIPAEVIEKEKEIYEIRASSEGKTGAVMEKIVTGRLEKFYEEVCLLDQPFVKDQDIKVKELIERRVAEIGENIRVKRFARYMVGE